MAENSDWQSEGRIPIICNQCTKQNNPNRTDCQFCGFQFPVPLPEEWPDWITEMMTFWGWDGFWYAGIRGPGTSKEELIQASNSRSGPRWHCGTWTGPQNDLIALKHCDTNEDAEEFLSPGGWTPRQAVELAIEKALKLGMNPAVELDEKSNTGDGSGERHGN